MHLLRHILPWQCSYSCMPTSILRRDCVVGQKACDHSVAHQRAGPLNFRFLRVCTAGEQS